MTNQETTYTAETKKGTRIITCAQTEKEVFQACRDYLAVNAHVSHVVIYTDCGYSHCASTYSRKELKVR